MLKYIIMEMKDIYANSQSHKIISLDKSRGMLSHAYFVECSDKFLLDNFSILMAKEIFCSEGHTPCLKCNYCQKVEHGNMVDLKIYPKDKNIMVEDVCQIIADSIQKPMDSVYKVYILKDFDNATTQAQNKLLKTLEEPPTNVIFIITTTNSSAVLSTIKSRVKTISEPVLDCNSLSQFLADKGVKNHQSIAMISGGSISTALKFASGIDSEKIINLVFDTLIGLRSSADILKYSSQIIALKKDFTYFIDTMISVLRDISVSSNSKLINFQNRINDIQMLGKNLSAKAISQITQKLCEIYNKLDFNCNVTGVVDQLLLDILEVKFLCQN